jgi:hypothetical protein
MLEVATVWETAKENEGGKTFAGRKSLVLNGLTKLVRS